MTHGPPADDFDLAISPKPTADEYDAILGAVAETLRREADLARPSLWRVAGWVGQRVGITDLDRWLPATRRWPLSASLPRGGRVFVGLSGRGDAK